MEHWPAWADDSASTLAQRLLALARHIKPSQMATSKRGPKVKKTRDWVDGATARAHLSYGPCNQSLKKQKTLKGLAFKTAALDMGAYPLPPSLRLEEFGPTSGRPNL
ncbi:hypothetical protein [Azotobacter armeniacus]